MGIQANAAKFYVADVSGDYREEMIVYNGETQQIEVYWNPASNRNSKPRYWEQNVYRRLKDNFNYYSP